MYFYIIVDSLSLTSSASCVHPPAFKGTKRTYQSTTVLTQNPSNIDQEQFAQPTTHTPAVLVSREQDAQITSNTTGPPAAAHPPHAQPSGTPVPQRVDGPPRRTAMSYTSCVFRSAPCSSITRVSSIPHSAAACSRKPRDCAPRFGIRTGSSRQHTTLHGLSRCSAHGSCSSDTH